LELDRAFLLAAISQVQVPMMAADPTGQILMVNAAWAEFHPVPPSNVDFEIWVRQFKFFDARGIHPMPAELSPLSRLIRGEVVKDYEYSVMSKTGELRFRRSSGVQIKDANGAVIGLVMVLHDITKQRHLQNELERRAQTDSLTGLANQVSLLMQLKEMLRNVAQPVTVLLCDVDRFKWVNDAFGHSVGDKLIFEIGQRIQEAVGTRGTVGRLGGDEFVVITDSCATASAQHALVEHIRTSVGCELKIEGALFHISLSIGMASSSAAETTPESLLRDADTAMYRAKERGADVVAFDDVMRKTAKRRFEVRSEVETALEHHGFKLLYQPIIDTRRKCVVGAEALLRLHSKSGIGPAEFVPVAEASGLAERLDRWVIEEAGRQLQLWHSLIRDVPFYMACNVSARSIASTHWTREVLAVATAAAAHRLHIEMTETAMVNASQESLANLAALRSAGIEVGLDDFGTGYASLTHLRKMPISFLKIDRSFVTDIQGSGEDKAIVKAIVDMARALHLGTVAEGVECEGEAQALTEIGCDTQQGYFYDRPLEAEALSKILERQNNAH
jgi:diguanylate cyclase (GGDEF)-like protein